MLLTDPCHDDIIVTSKPLKVQQHSETSEQFVALILSLQQLYISVTFHCAGTSSLSNITKADIEDMDRKSNSRASTSQGRARRKKKKKPSDQFSDSHQGRDNQRMNSEFKELSNIRLVSLKNDLEVLMESFYDMDGLEDQRDEHWEDILDNNKCLNNDEEITAWESEENIALEESEEENYFSESPEELEEEEDDGSVKATRTKFISQREKRRRAAAECRLKSSGQKSLWKRFTRWFMKKMK